MSLHFRSTGRSRVLPSPAVGPRARRQDEEQAQLHHPPPVRRRGQDPVFDHFKGIIFPGNGTVHVNHHIV